MTPLESQDGLEAGYSLAEMLIAMAIFALVVSVVYVSVSVLTARSTGLTESSEAIDQLQTAEQTIVQDLHAASSWSTSPASVATTLVTALSQGQTNVTDLTIASVPKAITAGDTIVVGSNSAADSFIASSSVSASSSQTAVPVTSATATNAESAGSAVYDTATVPLDFTADLDGSSLTTALASDTYYTSLPVTALRHEVSTGDTIVVGTGTTTDTFVASGPASRGALSISVNKQETVNSHPVGDPVFDYNTTISISGTGTSRSLTVTTDGASPITVTNLDPSSGFTYTQATAGGTTYYNAIGVSLTVDSPRVGAPHETKTTMADSDVEVWPVEYTCSAVSETAGGNSC